MAVWRSDSRLSGFDSHAGGSGDEIKLPSVAIRPPELRMAVQSHGQFERRIYYEEEKMRSKKLTQAFDDFTDKMKKRLNHKEREGFTGWDYKALSSDFIERAIRKLRNPLADEKDFVDVANFAMFLAHIKGAGK